MFQEPLNSGSATLVLQRNLSKGMVQSHALPSLNYRRAHSGVAASTASEGGHQKAPSPLDVQPCPKITGTEQLHATRSYNSAHSSPRGGKRNFQGCGHIETLLALFLCLLLIFILPCGDFLLFQHTWRYE